MFGRAQALAQITPHAKYHMERLSDDQERLDLTYKPALGGLEEFDCPLDEPEWIARLLRALQRVRQREIQQGTTVVGPHRDDFAVEIDGMPADAFGSRAQQRSAALALRIAEALYLRQALGDDPVVLLDDVLSELDARRRRGVLEILDTFQQTIVTTADADRVRDVLTRASGRFVVIAGTISRFEGE